MTPDGTDRGVSELLAFVLTFSIIILSVGVVSVAGIGALEEVKSQTQTNAAEKAMEGFAAAVEDQRDGHAPSRLIEFQLGGNHLERQSTTLNVSVELAGGGYVNETVNPGVFVRESGDRASIVYSTGALFRNQRQGLSIVDGPALRCSADSAHVSLVRLTGNPDITADGFVQVETTRTDSRVVVPNVSSSGSAQEVSAVTVNVTATRYRAGWERLFENQLRNWEETADGHYTCDGIDRAVVRLTTLRLDVIV